MDLREVPAYSCGKCGAVYTQRRSAAECCVCSKCQRPMRARGLCADCRAQQRLDVCAKRLAAATPVATTEHMLYSDDLAESTTQGGYFNDVEHLLDYCVGHDIVPPREVFCTVPQALRLSLGGALTAACEDIGLDDYDRLVGVAELDAAVTAFNVANAAIRTYVPDYTHKYVIPEQERQSAIAQLQTDPEEESD